MTPTALQTFIGDYTGRQTGDAPGEVQWTAFTTNDTTTASTTSLLTVGGKDLIEFQDMVLVGAASTVGTIISATTAGSTDIVFRRCTLLSAFSNAGFVVSYVGTAGAAANWTFDRCNIVVMGNMSWLGVTVPRHTADYNINIVFENCFVWNSYRLVRIVSSGTGVGFGNGVHLRSCTFFCNGANVMQTIDANISTNASNASTVYNSLFISGNANSTASLVAFTSGQIIEDYNLFYACSTPRSNVSVGANSLASNYAPLFEFGQDILLGSIPRYFPGTPFTTLALGFGNKASSPTPPTVDFLGRQRPSGGLSASNAIGALEYHDKGSQDTTYADGGSGACLKLVGPMDYDLYYPVDTTSTTISVKVRWDGNHGDTTRPQAQLLANDELQYAGQTVTATTTGGSGATPNSYETLTFTAFTPTSKGVVVLRLINRPTTAASGASYWDTVT